MKRSKGFDEASPGARTILIAISALSVFMFSGCAHRLRRLESNQIMVEEKVDANTTRLEIMAHKMEQAQNQLQASLAQMKRSQGELQAGIAEVKESNEITLAEAIATRYEQRKLRESSDNHGDIIRSGVDQLKEKQRALGQSIGQVDSRTQDIDADIAELASDQQRLGERISGNHRRVAAELGEVRENQVKMHGMSAEALAQAENISKDVHQIQREQASLSRTIKDNDQTLQAQVKGMAQQQEAMHETLSDTYAVSLIVANNVGQLQDGQADFRQSSQTHADQLNRGITEIKAMQVQQADLHALVQTQADKLGESLNGLQRGQVNLSTGIQKNQDIAQQIVTGMKKLQAQQEALRKLLQDEADDLGAVVTEIDNRQTRMALDLESNRKIVSDIRGDLTQGQVRQANGRMKAMEGRLTTLDGSVSKFEGRLAALSDAVQAYQQQRAEKDKGLSEGLASLAQTLEQIKVNQMLLNRRLSQAREDTRVYSERVQTRLEQLHKESLKVNPTPKTRPAPPPKEEIETDK